MICVCIVSAFKSIWSPTPTAITVLSLFMLRRTVAKIFGASFMLWYSLRAKSKLYFPWQNNVSSATGILVRVLLWQAVLPPSTNCITPRQFFTLGSCTRFKLPLSLSFVNKIINALKRCLTKESPIRISLETRLDVRLQALSVVKLANMQPSSGTQL